MEQVSWDREIPHKKAALTFSRELNLILKAALGHCDNKHDRESVWLQNKECLRQWHVRNSRLGNAIENV